MQHVESVARGTVEAGFAAAAQLIETDRGERTDQRKAGGNRERQRQHGIAQRHSDQSDAEQRIDDAEEDRVTGHRDKVVDAARQRIEQIGRCDAADDEIFRARARADKHM